MTTTALGDFTFAGYLIQEPYWHNWPLREGFRVASIEREIHPNYDKPQWNLVEGVINPTKFVTEFPNIKSLVLEPHKCQSVFHSQSPGWSVNGYSFPSEIIKGIVLTSKDVREEFRAMAYAFHLHREADGLLLLGYEVVDLDVGFPFLSILNNCGYTVEQVSEMAGPLNQYSLLGLHEEAQLFIQAIKRDRKHSKRIPNHSNGIAVQVWGSP